MDSALSLQKVSKSFTNQSVLRELSLDVAKGEFLAVLGPSGSGKTTLLRLVAGFDFPDAGEISIGGKTVASEKVFIAADQRRVGYVPQDAALFPTSTSLTTLPLVLRE